MGASGSTGPEAVAAAEKNAAILTAKAGARDPSAIPSICRISAALQYPAGESSFIWYNIRSMCKIRCHCLHLRLGFGRTTSSPFGQFLLESFSLLATEDLFCLHFLVVYVMVCQLHFQEKQKTSV